MTSPAAAPVAELTAAAAEVMAVDDVTGGLPPGDSVRLRGRLTMAADAAWEFLESNFRPLGYTPMLRRRDGAPGEEIMALRLAEKPRRQRHWLALLMFGLTLLACLFVGAQMWEWAGQSGAINLNLLDGWPYAAALLGILLAHEMGHYLVARRLGTPTSLPYFLPVPLPGSFGTLGAVISMNGLPRNRRHLLLIGAAGPLAGLVVALPVLYLGLQLSSVQPLPPGGYQMEGNSLLYAAMKYLVFGRFLPTGGEDVFIHPVAFAGWAGLLVTALNLIPVGQLDGGHILYAVSGRKGSRITGWVVLAALAGLALLWNGWLLWLALAFLFGRLQDTPMDDITELTAGQRVFAAAMAVLLVLVFVPVPLQWIP